MVPGKFISAQVTQSRYSQLKGEGETVFWMVHRFSKSERREREGSSKHDDNEDAKSSLTTRTVQTTSALRYMSYWKLSSLLEIAASMNRLGTTRSVMFLHRHNT